MDDNVTLEQLKKRVQELEQAALENKGLEAALRASEEKHRFIAENTAEMISVMDMNLRVTYASPAILRFRGFTVEEFMEQTPDQMLTPESLLYALSIFEQELQLEVAGTADPDRSRILELEQYKKDGSIIWVEVSQSFLRDKNRKPVGIFTLSKDITERRQAEEALRESEIKYRTLFESAAAAIMIVEPPSWRFTSGNPSMIRMFKAKDEAEFLSLGPWDVSPETQPDGRRSGDKALEMLETAMRDGSLFFEWTHRRLNGEDFPATVLLTRMKMGDKEVIQGTVRDISERKQAEAALQRFKETIENSSNVIGMSTPEGKHFYQNAAFDNLFGSLGDNPPSSLYVDKSVPEEMFKTIAAGGRWDGEVKMVAKDGSVRDILLRAYANKDSNGRVTALVGLHTDITERKWMENVLRESVARFRALFNATSDSVILIDPAGTILDLNENAAHRRDMETDAMLGRNLFDFLPPEAADLRRKAVERILIEKKLVQHDEDRGGKHYSIRLFPVMDDTGKVIQVASFSHDFTESKRAEAENAKLEKQFHQAQKMESVGRLAGGVAHDFNNMLSVILGFAEMAMGKVDPSQPLFADLTEIRKAAGRSADLTRQLLAFARKQTIAPKILDLNETVAGMINMLRRLIGEDIDLIWKPGANLWPVKMDPSQIDQILANLCVNARDAINEVGSITIETKNIAIDNAFCADKPGFVPGEYLRLSVSDTGKGMDKETLGQIFEPFFTTKAMGKGTGLGLATVYGIVKQNNGFIDVDSESGQGTTFTAYLPRHTAKAWHMQKESPAEQVLRGHETILLVEDEPAILEMTTQMLEMHGYNVLAANTPGEAVRLAREHKGEIHLLMTDIVMPEMNGRDLAKNLLSLYPGIKRLFMSGYTADVIAHHGVLEDGVQFIQKPFSIKELAAKVREALGN